MGFARTKFAGLRSTLCFFALLTAAKLLSAQTYGDRVDLYFGDWHSAPVRTIYGSLREQDVLTSGDALHPEAKGAVLRSVRSFRHATLGANASTRPILYDSNGRVASDGSRGPDSIGVYALATSTGKLTQVEEQPTVILPRTIAFDPTETFLLAASELHDKIVVYKREQTTGKLSATGDAVPAENACLPGFLAGQIAKPTTEFSHECARLHTTGKNRPNRRIAGGCATWPSRRRMQPLQLCSSAAQLPLWFLRGVSH